VLLSSPAVMLEIMTGAVPASAKCLSHAPKAEQRASDMEAPPEREGVECRNQSEA